MSYYFLDYDLRQKRDYQTLYAELTKFNAIRLLESLWCFKRANISATELLAHFRHFVDANDALCVSQVADWDMINTLGNPKQLI